eukprot:gb/GECG01011764.1/.p1 GENE.gb/GECG01011764.1/~~gb/GECG01011764.1/.p1  ORF type:complete len:196 (+),score=30.14 gb/GECG01011764.1/:1-588(+)
MSARGSTSQSTRSSPGGGTAKKSTVQRKKEHLMRRMQQSENNTEHLNIPAHVLHSRHASRALQQTKEKRRSAQSANPTGDRMSNLPDTELGRLSTTQARKKITGEHNEHLLKRSERVNEKTAEEKLQSLRNKIKDEMAREVEMGHEVPSNPETEGVAGSENTEIFPHTQTPQYSKAEVGVVKEQPQKEDAGYGGI